MVHSIWYISNENGSYWLLVMADKNMVQNAVKPKENHEGDENGWENEENDENCNDAGK